MIQLFLMSCKSANAELCASNSLAHLDATV